MTKPASLVPLNKALESLERAIAQPENEFNRDSVIQRFEFTLELSWKAIKRKLENDGLQFTDHTPKGIIREAAASGAIRNPEVWFKLIDDRNRTSHTYNESVAKEVYASAKLLPELVRKTLPWLSS